MINTYIYNQQNALLPNELTCKNSMLSLETVLEFFYESFEKFTVLVLSYILRYETNDK